VVAPPPPRERPPRAPATAVQRLRKASRRLLVIAAAEPGAQTLADRLREDDFRQVVEARSYLEAQNAARAFRFDLVLLDVKVGGHLGQMILETLRRHGFLTDTPVILVADRRDANIADVAEALGAVHVHEKRASYEELAPVLYELL
jgi:CheY-like chemotaxis protein